MKTSRLDYCRHLTAQYKHLLNNGRDIPSRLVDHIEDALYAAKNSVKFILPDNGVWLDDAGLRALADDALQLPFKQIALEYAQEPDPTLTDTVNWTQCSRRILFAAQMPDCILLLRSSYSDQLKSWITAGPVAVPKEHFINREMGATNGKPGVALVDLSGQTEFSPELWCNDFASDVYVLLSFLNALACANVRIDKVAPPEKVPGRQEKKQALPYDTYHVLTIDTAARSDHKNDVESSALNIHRSPREHLRRGHIRHLANGQTIWINATVVKPDQGAGKVVKSYRLV